MVTFVTQRELAMKLHRRTPQVRECIVATTMNNFDGCHPVVLFAETKI
jgi:hypothetical protein